MNANNLLVAARPLFAVLALFGGSLSPAPVLAIETVAPALANVKEIVLQDFRVNKSSAYEKCGVNTLDLSAGLLKSLKRAGLPVFSVLQSKPPQVGVARIELVPELLTNYIDSLACVSWVSLTAQTQNTLLIPPVNTARNVMVTYWRSGLLVNSNESGHGNVLKQAYDKLNLLFAEQYKRDQPPELKSLEGDKTEQ